MTNFKGKKIKSCMIVQQLKPQYFRGWSREELSLLLRSEGSCRIQPFVERLSKNNVLRACYLIFHNKDNKIPHLHLVLDFWYPTYTVKELSDLTGIPTFCIENGENYWWSLDRFLAYLVHAKDPQKHQYQPSEVISWVDSRMYQNQELLYENIYQKRIKAWKDGIIYKQKNFISRRSIMTNKNKKNKSYYEPVTVQAAKYCGKFLNQKKAFERGLKPKPGAEGVMLWESCWHSKLEPYYSIEEDLEPATEDEISEFFEQLRLERNCKARERYHERKREKEWERKKAQRRLEVELERRAYEDSFKTAWQWLSQEKRIPKEDAEAYLQEKWYLAGYEWETTERYYYQEDDTRPVTDWEYEKLKELYINKFGGWEKIDLENTAYDGRVWWDYKILVPELEGQDDFLDEIKTGGDTK